MYITVPTNSEKVLPALYVEDMDCNGRHYRVEWETGGTYILVTGNPTETKPGVRVEIHHAVLHVTTFTLTDDGKAVDSEPIAIVQSRSADLENESLRAVVDCALTLVRDALAAAPDKPAPVEPDLTNAF